MSEMRQYQQQLMLPEGTEILRAVPDAVDMTTRIYERLLDGQKVNLWGMGEAGSGKEGLLGQIARTLDQQQYYSTPRIRTLSTSGAMHLAKAVFPDKVSSQHPFYTDEEFNVGGDLVELTAKHGEARLKVYETASVFRRLGDGWNIYTDQINRYLHGLSPQELQNQFAIMFVTNERIQQNAADFRGGLRRLLESAEYRNNPKQQSAMINMVVSTHRIVLDRPITPETLQQFVEGSGTDETIAFIRTKTNDQLLKASARGDFGTLNFTAEDLEDPERRAMAQELYLDDLAKEYGFLPENTLVILPPSITGEELHFYREFLSKHKFQPSEVRRLVDKHGINQ